MPQMRVQLKVIVLLFLLIAVFAGGDTVDPAVFRVAKADFFGLNGQFAAASQEALEIALNHTGEIHLLLIDLVLPGMNGKILAEQALALRPQAKTLFMTGYTAASGIDPADLADSRNLLMKPFDEESLARKLREIFG